MLPKTFQIILFISIIFNAPASFAQKTNLSREFFQVNAGHSFHGTGDMNGIIFGAGYLKEINNKWSWRVGFDGTIHDDSYPLFYNHNNTMYDLSIRSNTSGIQLYGHAGFNFIRSERNRLNFLFGPVFRYQSSTYSGYTIIYEPITGLPYPVVVFDHREPMRTFTIGLRSLLEYNYAISNKYSVGIAAGLQTDTNGDLLRQLTLNFARRL